MPSSEKKNKSKRTVPEKSILKKENSATSASLSSSTDKSKSVFFGDICIYEFPNKLGDNPGVSEGAPLTIGWKHESKNVVAVDYYEFMRQSKPRRKRKDLIVPSAARDT